ncbi:DUF3618 domain-containing protein [Sphingomonas immobilis]|uniref:DUF3618 domain-containing protein n=1 Tax=Sphingomonas immobilis TaxID=3063997 RepID=A0ABT8ZVE1_9SPHN|nr:DUF3618 domain-containing protein [Sphingomonas sp. CA1-15]MDO7841187.1 DUF3618 domain-containing protein [Sphingomonas sp. CA1-15]
MTDERTELTTAEERSQLARSRLAGTLVAIQARLKPAALARDAIDELRETGQELAHAGIAAAKRNPLRVAGVVAAVGLFAARGPIAALFRRKPAETEPTPKSYSRRKAAAATKGSEQ